MACIGVRNCYYYYGLLLTLIVEINTKFQDVKAHKHVIFSQVRKSLEFYPQIPCKVMNPWFKKHAFAPVQINRFGGGWIKGMRSWGSNVLGDLQGPQIQRCSLKFSFPLSELLCIFWQNLFWLDFGFISFSKTSFERQIIWTGRWKTISQIRSGGGENKL